MQAEEALKQSQARLIVADAFRGLVIIQQECVPENGAAKCFRVRFVPHDAQEREHGREIITVGSYDDLDMAVTIAAVKHGVSDEAWMPATRYAIAVLGTALLRGAAIDASCLSRQGPEQGE